MEKVENERGKGTYLFVFILGLAAVILISSFDQVMRKWFGLDYEKSGQFGDQFGAVNALFSGLAFLGLIVTITFQTRDLRLQTEALKLQIEEFKEQKEEMRRTAEAQEQANHIKLGEMRLSISRMKVELNFRRAESEPTLLQRHGHLDKSERLISDLETQICRSFGGGEELKETIP